MPPFIIDEFVSPSKYQLLNGYYIEWLFKLRKVTDLSLHAKRNITIKVLSKKVNSNVPKHDLALILYCIRERLEVFPERIVHYFEKE